MQEKGAYRGEKIRRCRAGREAPVTWAPSSVLAQKKEETRGGVKTRSFRYLLPPRGDQCERQVGSTGVGDFFLTLYTVP